MPTGVDNCAFPAARASRQNYIDLADQQTDRLAVLAIVPPQTTRPTSATCQKRTQKGDVQVSHFPVYRKPFFPPTTANAGEADYLTGIFRQIHPQL